MTRATANIPFRPTKQQIIAAYGRTIRDVIAPHLSVLFVGINPGLYTAAIGHHFGRPGNRFWPALRAGGFTPRVFSPFDERELLALGYGITNLVARATARADELTIGELRAGAVRLSAKIKRYRPRIAAVVGLGAYRIAFNRRAATLGLQKESIGDTRLWLLPNPSGLNAHHQPRQLATLFAELHHFAGRLEKPR